MLQSEFFTALKNYTKGESQIHLLWREIEKVYSQPSRHYHNLSHLNTLLADLKPLHEKFIHWNTVVMAIAYHDAVYNTLKQNNEEKSAALAVKRLSSIGFSKDQVGRVEQFILATKKHETSDEEINLFTDADLAILGADAETYQQYATHIRQEYSLYPDLIYNPGRRKVMNHFLNMPEIYKTEVFRSRYEVQARVNLEAELRMLQ